MPLVYINDTPDQQQARGLIAEYYKRRTHDQQRRLLLQKLESLPNMEIVLAGSLSMEYSPTRYVSDTIWSDYD